MRSILVVEYLGLEQLTNSFGLFLLFQGLGALIGSPFAGKSYHWLLWLSTDYISEELGRETWFMNLEEIKILKV